VDFVGRVVIKELYFYNSPMQPTSYTDVNELIEKLLLKIKSILGSKLIGLYLEGSLVLGDFDPKTSDIDLLAALSKDIDGNEYEALRKMHAAVSSEYREWDDRIEVCYISVDALRSAESRTSQIVNISPGEPFHRTESSKEWLMNWYLTREKSKTLFGPSPITLIAPISKEEFIQSVKDNARSWGKWVEGMKNRYAQSYAILSMCRALFSYKKGDQVSKKEAAEWAQRELPEWSTLIQNAIDWKEAGKDNQDDEINFPKTVQFVNRVRSLILEG
jgi:predicted nucleotidyltransferase